MISRVRNTLLSCRLSQSSPRQFLIVEVCSIENALQKSRFAQLGSIELSCRQIEFNEQCFDEFRGVKLRT